MSEREDVRPAKQSKTSLNSSGTSSTIEDIKQQMRMEQMKRAQERIRQNVHVFATRPSPDDIESD